MNSSADSLSNAKRVLLEEVSNISKYISSGDKVRMIYTVNNIEEMLEENEEGREELVESSNKFKSIIMITPNRFTNSEHKMKFYNNLLDLLLKIQWNIDRIRGLDIPEEPYEVEEVVEEGGEGEETETPDNLEQMIGGGVNTI